jgi:WD40 repeat protein
MSLGAMRTTGSAPQYKRVVTLRGHSDAIQHLAISVDGKTLASSGESVTSGNRVQIEAEL